MTKILVIDDEKSIRENLLDLLDAEEFETIEAENGAIGIKLAMEHIPDLILCDVMMPETDGYDVLKALRSHSPTATIPFIFFTAKTDRSDTRQGMELGADDYLTKPCTAEELINAIATRLEKQEIIIRQSEEKLDELRRNIAYSLPHELRTPLNGIMGLAELLLDEYDSIEAAEAKEMLAEIQFSSKRLYRLIQNFLLYAELEIIAKTPEKIAAIRQCQTTSIQELIESQVMQQAKQANREADLILKLQDSSVNIDATRLQKIIEELVDNAFKFSIIGTEVTVSCFVDKNTNKFVLSVTDKGRGMTPEEISKIGANMQFERKLYEQQGSGLGLVIAKNIAELHGGTLAIDSDSQQTEVRVYLPV